MRQQKWLYLWNPFCSRPHQLGRRNQLEAATKHLGPGVGPEDMTAYYQPSVAYRKTGRIEMAQNARFRILNEDERNLGIGRLLTSTMVFPGSMAQGNEAYFDMPRPTNFCLLYLPWPTAVNQGSPVTWRGAGTSDL